MYDYEEEKKKLFTEKNQVLFLQIRDRAKALLKESGAASMRGLTAKVTGDNWLQIACVDRLLELKEIAEVPRGGCFSQNRVFVKPGE